ncbi:hypothetical protein CFOL_v3_25829 [Cephalotus follicularis]|uniref:Uncharacterized protein n=1 Tax=Cephalotus follicularis TaxID=3775 RepID=A0A1Q3CQ66_CEPFO|nr:hypothetical protein CFOL_v3_25829 [Cephalotus follicularis]
MAETQRNKSANGGQRLSSRLQRRAPASLQISPVSTWNVAIPLLSPLATSPSSPKMINNRTAEMLSQEQHQQRHSISNNKNHVAEPEKPVFKKWQHPAAPFCYEPAPLRPSFVPV